MCVKKVSICTFALVRRASVSVVRSGMVWHGIGWPWQGMVGSGTVWRGNGNGDGNGQQSILHASQREIPPLPTNT